MNKFIISESERSEILKKHSSYKTYLMENVTNYSLQDLQTVLQTKLGLSLGKSGVDGKFGKMTKAAIIQGLDMVKNQVNPVVPVETTKDGGVAPEVKPEVKVPHRRTYIWKVIFIFSSKLLQKIRNMPATN